MSSSSLWLFLSLWFLILLALLLLSIYAYATHKAERRHSDTNADIKQQQLEAALERPRTKRSLLRWLRRGQF